MKCKICNTEGSIYSVETTVADFRMYLDENGMFDYDTDGKNEWTLEREIVCRNCGHQFQSEEELL